MVYFLFYRYRGLFIFPWLFIFLVTVSHSQLKTDPNLGIIPAPYEIRLGKEMSNMYELSVFLDEKYANPFLDSLIGLMPSLIKVFTRDSSDVFIHFEQSELKDAYRLVIDTDRIDIEVSSTEGLQYALVSLVQMIQHTGFPLPVVEINDRPRFIYRGMHLDVCRHFFSVEEIKKHLDYMAFYKYNHFHWHLTEDQGWRIEIKKYPRLQEVAAFRKETLSGHYNDVPHTFDGQRYGGYYTHEDIREIVAYASQRHISIIPEIEMPGHSLAALAAYPELSCDPDKNYEVATKWGVFADVYCPTEATFTFLEGVIDEVIALFPGPYIHIGGDECPKEAWKNSPFCQELIQREGLKDENELQSYFISRMEKYINSRGKKIMGWDEILEGGLAPHATVMSWRGVKGGIEAALLGHDVIMTPGSHCYFDHYQSESPSEPVAIGGLTTLEKVYHWNPVPESLDSAYHKYILGGQANIWTEYIRTYAHVEYMSYARGMAMAEALWSGNKNYTDFLTRFIRHCEYWENKGAQVAFHVFDLKPRIIAGNGLPVTLEWETQPDADIYFSYHNQEFQLLDASLPFSVEKSGTFTFFQRSEDREGRHLSLNFDLHKGTQAQVTLVHPPTSPYIGQGAGSLVNGVHGSDHKYGGSEWLGFSGQNCELQMDFREKTYLNEILFRFYKGEGQWIYLPEKVELWVSEDGKDFEKLAETYDIGTNEKVATVSISYLNTHTRYLKILIHNFGEIPLGRQGAGHGAWLFVDEIVVR